MTTFVVVLSSGFSFTERSIFHFCNSYRLLKALPSSELPSCGLDFWINLYNALVMHASVVVGYPTDKESRAEFFSGATGAKYEWLLTDCISNRDTLCFCLEFVGAHGEDRKHRWKTSNSVKWPCQ